MFPFLSLVGLSMCLALVACGGSSSKSADTGEPAEFTWKAPVEEWWGMGDRACPDGGSVKKTEQGNLTFRQCERGDTSHGPRGAWLEDGTLVTEGLLRDGEPTGRWREWQPDGTLAAIAYFDDGVLSGTTTQYLTGGARAEEQYKDGNREGVSRLYESGDRLVREMEYRAGLPHGKQTEYYPSGKPRTITFHKDGLIHGTVTRYAPNGDTIGSFDIDSGNGAWTEWHDNGKVSTKTTIKSGKQNGPYVRFHPDGKKAIEGAYKEGVEAGGWRAWDEAGGLRAVNKYKDGMPIRADTYDAGKLVRKEQFYQDGGRKSRTGYDGKRRDGDSITWNDDGYRSSQGAYKSNKKTGDWYVFNKDNTPTLEVYKNGKRVRRGKAEVAAKPPAADGIETGIERCDRYLRAYLSCPGIPANIREDFTKNFRAWDRQLETATGEDADKLERACSDAEETWKKGLATAGCA